MRHGVDDAADGLIVQIRVHRQAHDAFGHGIADRQRDAFIGHGGLAIQGDGIMDGGGNAGGLQGGLHGVAPVDLHGVLRPGADVVGFDDGRGLDARGIEQPGVGVRHALAGGDFLVQDGQLRQQDGGLEGVQAAVHADPDVVVAAVLPVAGDLAQDRRQCIVVGEDGAAVPIAAQGFAREKAGTGDGGQVTALAAFVAAAQALGRVFDDRQSVLVGDGVDGVHVGALAIQRDGNDGASARGDGGFQPGGVQGVGARVDVDVDGLGAQQGDGLGRGDVGEARGDDLVARPDPQRHLGDLQSIGAVGDGDAVPGAGIGGQAFFQLGDFRPQDELAVGQHALDVGIDFGFQALVLGLQVDELHGVSVVDKTGMAGTLQAGTRGKLLQVIRPKEPRCPIDVRSQFARADHHGRLAACAQPLMAKPANLAEQRSGWVQRVPGSRANQP